MIAKKNPKVNLEKKRFAFFQIGLIVSGSLCLAAFDYASVDNYRETVTVLENEEYGLSDPEIFEYDDQKPQKKIVATSQRELIDEATIVTSKIKEGISKSKISKIIFEGDDPDAGIVFGEIEDEDDIVLVPDFEPEYIGGLEAMYAFIADIVVYPSIEAEMGIGGTAYIEFVVNRNGSICQVKEVGNDVDLTDALRAEAIRVVSSMPKWKPGEQAGKTVRVRYTIPIRFIAPR